MLTPLVIRKGIGRCDQGNLRLPKMADSRSNVATKWRCASSLNRRPHVAAYSSQHQPYGNRGGWQNASQLLKATRRFARTIATHWRTQGTRSRPSRGVLKCTMPSGTMPDLEILDIGLGDEIDGGLVLCRGLRATSASLPIIFLLARDSDLDVVSKLRLGADD